MTIEQAEITRDELAIELDALYAEIEAAAAEGRPTEVLEAAWVITLARYEAACDRLQREVAA